jgi:hypothetical protein
MRLYRWGVALAVWACAVMVSAAASAQRNDGAWERIGTIRVDTRDNVSRVDLRNTRGRFNAFRLVATQAPIVLSNVAVTYGDGQVFNERRRINLLSGERTRPINPGRNDFVDGVAVTYDAREYAGRPRGVVLDVYGRRSGRREDLVAVRPSYPGSSPRPPVAGGGGSSPPPITTPVPDARPIQASPAPAGRCGGPGEQFLGTRTVGFGVDRDVIPVGAEVGKFDLIRLCVYENDIDLIGTRVNFTNGPSEVLPYAGLIRSEQRTQPLRFKGDRFIKDIEITYKKRDRFTGRARVEIWGEYADGWLDGEADKYAGGWAILSTHTARFVGFDTDTAVVPKNKGGFRQLRVDVQNRDITLRRVTVTYGDGQKEDLVSQRTLVKGGSSLGPLDLKGVRPVPIKEIEAVYRSRIFDRDAASGARAIVNIRGKR